MAVLNLLSFTLQVPDIAAGVRFYGDAGLIAAVDGNRAELRCPSQSRPSVVLIGGAPAKRLHHVTLRADHLDRMATNIVVAGGTLVPAPDGFAADGLWVRDPHGMLFHLVDAPADPAVASEPQLEMNGPGRIVRNRRAAVLPASAYGPARPRKLGHVLLFSPDVPRSVAFVTEGLGMGLADRAQDIIAFCCAARNSDHHVLAFAKSPGIGFHHASFQVGDPDEVGRAGRALHTATGRGEWGFGRHTIGSNYFHYIQDPWGSWFEYYADMDYIDDLALWTPTNYEMHDSLASWGPAVPADFVHNYEHDAA